MAKRLNHVFGNKFKYTDILETQFPSYTYHNKIPNFLMIYNNIIKYLLASLCHEKSLS